MCVRVCMVVGAKIKASRGGDARPRGEGAEWVFGWWWVLVVKEKGAMDAHGMHAHLSTNTMSRHHPTGPSFIHSFLPSFALYLLIKSRRNDSKSPC